MNRYPGQIRGLPTQVGVRPDARLSAGFLSQAFTWMFAGLLLTAGIAFVVQGSPRLLEAGRTLFLPAILVELGVVLGISFLINRISSLVALGLFFAYAALNGLTIGLIVSSSRTTSRGGSWSARTSARSTRSIRGSSRNACST